MSHEELRLWLPEDRTLGSRCPAPLLSLRGAPPLPPAPRHWLRPRGGPGTGRGPSIAQRRVGPRQGAQSTPGLAGPPPSPSLISSPARGAIISPQSPSTARARSAAAPLWGRCQPWRPLGVPAPEAGDANLGSWVLPLNAGGSPFPFPAGLVRLWPLPLLCHQLFRSLINFRMTLLKPWQGLAAKRELLSPRTSWERSGRAGRRCYNPGQTSSQLAHRA